MKTFQTITRELLMFALLASASAGTPSDKWLKNNAPPAQVPVVKTFATRQLSFEPLPRAGDDPVRFSARGAGYSLSVAPTEAEIFLWRSEASPASARRANVKASDSTAGRLRMKLVGANAKNAATGVDELPGKANYFSGRDPAKWRTNVATYAKVRCPQVYPGVDLVYYGNARQLEFDFVVAPGADPRQIALAFEGADKVELADNGDLVLQTGGQEFRQHKPVIYGSSGKCVPGSGNHWKCDLSESPVRSGALRKAREWPFSIPSKQSRCGRGFPIGRCRKANSFRQPTTSQGLPFP